MSVTPPPLAWVRDDERVVVVAEASGRSDVLAGPEACLWELWCDGEPDAAALVAELWDLDPDRAIEVSRRVRRLVRGLLGSGDGTEAT